MLVTPIKASRSELLLAVNVTTSTLKIHDSFDYESTTLDDAHCITSRQIFSLLTEKIFIFRSRITYKVFFLKSKEAFNFKQQQSSEIIGAFEISSRNHRVFLRVFDLDEFQGSSKNQMYLVVRSVKNEHNECVGVRLRQGSFLKVGQKQYFVSSIVIGSEQCLKGGSKTEQKLRFADKTKQRDLISVKKTKTEGDCKYCMMEEGDEPKEFLCSPCKCSGSCALVHFSCLEKWSESKIKKKSVSGLTCYNFERFSCQVCKEQYPKFIEKKGIAYELLPIELPFGDHMILEEVNLNVHSLICIESIPKDGVRIGRGHQCQIRVESPSISRNHATIKKIGKYFFIFDNRSKFGTSVKNSESQIELTHRKIGFQINRTVLMFDLIKNSHL